MKNLLMNQKNLLFMRKSKALSEFFRSQTAQLCVFSPHELRVMQYQFYVDFMRYCTGVDITQHPEKDPFFNVTGYSFYVWYIQRQQEYPHTQGAIRVQSPHVDLLSRDVIDSFPKREHGRERILRLANGKNHQAICFHPIDDGQVFATTSTERQICFGAIHSYFYRESRVYLSVSQGVFFLNPEMIDLLRQSNHCDELYQMLTEITTWSSHDMTGHATLDFEPTFLRPENTCLQPEQMTEYEKFMVPGDRNSFQHYFFNEMRHLNLHMCLVRELIKAHPVVERLLMRHVCCFATVLRTSADNISNKQLSRDFFTYFLDLYLFSLLRIVDYDVAHKAMCMIDCERYMSAFLKRNQREYNIAELSSTKPGAPFMTPENLAKGNRFTNSRIMTIPHHKIFKDINKHLQLA